jgi:peptidoglycan/xylan/chitin deacetylase (PgdA/CDA1 family)
MSAALARSSWRRQRLLILCYHLVSMKDEHEWLPTLFMTRNALKQRFELIKNSRAVVLPLTEALQQLNAGTLPAKSICITFDDGAQDFYRHAYPLLRDFGFPATVYQSTYYCDLQKPVFNLACSYMLWKHRGAVLSEAPQFGITRSVDLSSESNRQAILRDLIAFADHRGLSGAAKDEVARQLAEFLSFDYQELCNSRMLQLMTPAEIAELSAQGMDFQLHTHRHRTPNDESLFRKEIRDNRKRLEEITGRPANHFCYPSGVYRREFLPWLRAEGITSATTCEASLASRTTNRLLLPRFVDDFVKSTLEFESWLDGTASVLAHRPASESLNHA